MSRRTYPKYKPSGVEWLGEIPSDWDAIPVKRRYAVQLGKMLQNNPESLTDIFVPYIKALHVLWGKVEVSDLPEMWASPSGLRQYEVKNGDLLVCEGGEAGRAGILVSPPDNCIIQNALHRVRAKNSSDVRFLMYVLHAVSSSGWFSVLCNRATIAHFTGEKFSELRIPLPSLDEQRAIATFLDRETERIDALIEKKQRQIKLLQEKRMSFITQAVTKGINPKIKMKNSGIEWLGEISEPWDIAPVKAVFVILNGSTPKTSEPQYWNGDIPWVTPEDLSNLAEPIIRQTGRSLSQMGYENCGTKLVPAGSIIISTRAPIGLIGVAGIPLCTNQGCRALVSKEGAFSKFYYYFFISADRELKSWGQGSTFTELTRPKLGRIFLALPPLDEQRSISAFLDQETARIDALIEKINNSIQFLYEYRVTLISVAVTGKINVQSEAAHISLRQRKASPAFQRTVLAAEIIDRLHKEPTFGHVKFQKILYLCEHHLQMPLEGNYRRKAAGPLDSRMLWSIEGQMKKLKWYEAHKDKHRIAYVPMEKAGDHRKYFDRYWGKYRCRLDSLIALLKCRDSKECEILATLFAAWNDLIISEKSFDDGDVVREVRSNWHSSKQQFSEKLLREKIQWMREKGLVPQGHGKTTAQEHEK